MAQSVFANPQPRYHKTDDPLADLAAITGFRGEGAERSVDDFTLDLEQELLGAFGRNEALADAAERSLDDELEAGFNVEFAAPTEDDLASQFDAAFDDGFDAAGVEPANSNAHPATAWEQDFALDDADFAIEDETPAPAQHQAYADQGAGVADLAAVPQTEAFVDLDFDDFDPADFETAAPAAESVEAEAVAAEAEEPDFEAELFARIEDVPASQPVAAAPPQSDPDFEAELNAILGHVAPAAAPPPAAPVAAPAAQAAPAAADPFAELAALAASYKAVRPSVFARAPTWTQRREEPAAPVQVAPEPAIVAPVRAAPVFVAPVQAEAAPVYDAPTVAADDDFDTVEYVEEAVPATDEIDVPELEFDVDPEPVAYAEMAADYDPAPYAAAPAATLKPAEEDELSGVEAQFSDFFDAEFDRMKTEIPVSGRSEAVDMAANATVGQDYAPSAANGSIFAANRTLMLAAGAAILLLVGAVAGYSFMGGDATPSQPAVIKADTDPVKVKPENPGGAEIANQDKAVYDKVAGEKASGAAEQKALVTTAEEPVDVNAAAAERAPAKSEDRVEAAPQETAMAGGMAAAVQPKKVRTLIVKPDGTLVAPEAPVEAAPAAKVQPVAEASGVSYQAPGAGLAADEAPAENAAATAEADPVKAAIAEEPVTEQPAAADDAAAKKAADLKAKAKADAKAKAKAEAKAKAKAEQVAAAPAEKAAAAGNGEWSIQIASQPSKEGAQASYKSLSGKYGSIIGGRGVSIVQADIPGKGTFFRVRVPAGSKADANELCARYQAAGGSCIIAR